jgi:succinate dehydrogenase / fumarate reductase cytochrome b subunit
MSTPRNQPSPRNWYKWFDPRGKDLGTYAFILNRITALGLTFYLFLHLIVLGQLAIGPEAYDKFTELLHNPVFVFGELLVVIAGIYHGLNGLRVGLTSFGIAIPYQKQIFIGLLVITILGGLFFGIRMFTA